MTRRRPDDIHFVKFMLLLIFLGPFGAHNFYVGRKWKGLFALFGILLLIASFVIFPVGTSEMNWDDMDPIRRIFDRSGLPFPLNIFPMDIPGLIAICMWVVDWFGVVIFNSYKYPVRFPTDTLKPKEEIKAEKKAAKGGKVKTTKKNEGEEPEPEPDIEAEEKPKVKKKKKKGKSKGKSKGKGKAKK
jgi:TM2 domain-containing membrane protein YozV